MIFDLKIMKKLELNLKNIIAFILLALIFFTILYCGYGVGSNRAIYSAAILIDTENVSLTFKEDASFDENDETIIIPQGTVIKPKYIDKNRISFFYSTKGYSIEENKSLTISEREELGIYCFHETPERFKEQEEIARIWDEAEQQAHAKRTKTISRIFIPTLVLGIVWLVVWFFFTRFLCMKRMYVLLYLLDAILLFAVYFCTSSLLYI